MRFFFDGEITADKTLSLAAEEAKHARKVLRLMPGAEVEITNGNGLLAKAKILDLYGDQMTVQILSVTKAQPSTPIHLWQALLKGPKMDWLLEKAGEIGVHTLQPMETKFSLADSERGERWERILHSAAKQSGNPFLPKLEPAAKLPFLLSSISENSLKVYLDPYVGNCLLTCLNSPPNPSPSNIVLALGPEGGFSPEELNLLKRAGFQGARLLPYILRGETAGIVAAGIAGHFLLSSLHRS